MPLMIIQRTDIAVVSGKVPEISPFLGSQEPLSVKITNRGGIPAYDIKVRADVVAPDGTETRIIETASLPKRPFPSGTRIAVLHPGDTLEYKFGTMADFSLPGDYAVTFSVDIEDFRPENNSLPPIATGKVDVYDGGLPFRERFAGLGQTHWGNRVVVPGLTAATFLTRSKFGRMYKGPGGHITAGLKDETADLLFTLDLSDYDASRDRLMLKTLLTSYSNEVSPNNQIFVRGNADLPWLPLYNWGAQLDDGVSRNLMITTISEVLPKRGPAIWGGLSTALWPGTKDPQL